MSQTPPMKKKKDRREKESLRSVTAPYSEPGRENGTISEPSRYNSPKQKVSMDLTEQVNTNFMYFIVVKSVVDLILLFGNAGG